MRLGAKSKAPEPPPRPSGAELSAIAARWRAFRSLYPLYAELARRFELGAACGDLESPVDRSEPDVLKAVEAWFTAIDERSEAWQLRQLLQTTPLGTEEVLSALVTRYLGRQEKTGQDRDKIDFLLVQYLDQRAPHSLQNGSLELEDVASVLEPVLGEASTMQPAWMAPLDEARAELTRCRSLRDLLERGLIERVRALKEKAGEMFYGSAALLAFTRFNFLMRRAFFRCLYDDLRALRQQMHELERRGVQTIDCTRAQLSAEEPLERLQQICAQWKLPFLAPYAAGHSLQQLIEIRAAVQEALASQGATESAVNPASPTLAFSEKSP
ncbi:MAG TPA: hypothetical protein VES66_07120 [Terriglobales bacterium]|nr:hypothetical protein [Terriglobales bacterium]